jgi:hypothetical protein
MDRELKEGDRLIDTDGDTGTARDVKMAPDGVYRFTMDYDRGFTVPGLHFIPIDEPPPSLGYEHYV